MELQTYLMRCRKRVNEALDRILPSVNKIPRQLHQAMRYAVFNGGKRLRSAFIYAIGEALGAKRTVLDLSCASVELIHAFSLIHDDLPAIDNDDLRRGRPACHIAFGEATAILAGDALLALAFEVLANLNKYLKSPPANLQMIKLLSHYIGSQGMAGGEALDTATNDKTISLKKLALIYKLKTSYLICASVLLGALAANCAKKPLLKNLEKFGLYIGLAFQIHDDIIGIEVDTKTLGKPQGSDALKHKPTYPQIVGLSKAKHKEREYFSKAIQSLKKAGLANKKIVHLSKFAIARGY